MHMVVLVQQQRYLAVPFNARHRLYRHSAQFLGMSSGFQIVVEVSHI
jgi:hypothetical protein